MIKKITIENIKGIENKEFELNIHPNKPIILVAPNGFGKSSLAIAFKSLNNRRLKLDENNYHKNDSNLIPRLIIDYNGNILEATNGSNTINSEFSSFVINNKLFAKGKGSQYGTATATLNIESITIIDRIPDNVRISSIYSVTEFGKSFGENGKILPNLGNIYSNKLLIEKISENYQSLEKAYSLKTQKNKIDSIIAEINNKQGTTEIIKQWLLSNKINSFRGIQHLKILADIISEYDSNIVEIDSYLYAIQLVLLYDSTKDEFKKICEYNNYLLEKRKFEELLSFFNNTWKDIKAKETGEKLVVEFPQAKDISNGQRDTLTFISMLFKATRELSKQKNILIIDEVFDYLDDVNLISLQYYISLFIDEFKKQNKEIYPIILTHLDPQYFKNYIFNKQQICYLGKDSSVVNEHFIKILRTRNNKAIDTALKDDISKYLLHYHNDFIDKRDEFKQLGLKELWGEGDKFRKYIEEEKDKYLEDGDYDPFAVCCAVRVKIEEIIYNKMDDNDKEEFLNTHKTREKLDFAQSKGVEVPDVFYLLGVIYNEAMHWKDSQDNITPVVTKLRNLTIKNMIQQVYKM